MAWHFLKPSYLVSEWVFGCKFDRSHPEARLGPVIKQTLSPTAERIRGPRAFLIFSLAVLPFPPSRAHCFGRSLYWPTCRQVESTCPFLHSACDHLVVKVLSSSSSGCTPGTSGFASATPGRRAPFSHCVFAGPGQCHLQSAAECSSILPSVFTMGKHKFGTLGVCRR